MKVIVIKVLEDCLRPWSTSIFFSLQLSDGSIEAKGTGVYEDLPCGLVSVSQYFSQKSREFFQIPTEVIPASISNSLWSQQNVRVFVVLERMVNKATNFSQSHTLIIKLANLYLIGRKCGVIFLSQSASVRTQQKQAIIIIIIRDKMAEK